MGNLCTQEKPTASQNESKIYFQNQIRGVTYVVGFGDIAQQPHEALVIPIDNEYNHTSQLGQDVMKRVGKNVENQILQQKETKQQLEERECVVTDAGQIQAQKIIHCTVPIWFGSQRQEENIFKDSIKNVLQKVCELKLGAVTLPAIACGTFGFPKQLCAQITIEACLEFFEECETSSSVNTINLLNSDLTTAQIFTDELKKIILHNQPEIDEAPKNNKENKEQQIDATQ